MSKDYQAVPGSKPRKLIRSQRPNNPSLVSHSVKIAFGQQSTENSTSQLAQSANKQASYILANPESKQSLYTQGLDDYNNLKSKKLPLIATDQTASFNAANENKPEYARSSSLPAKQAKDLIYDEALDQAKEQFNAKREFSSLGKANRNSLNYLGLPERESGDSRGLANYNRRSLSQLQSYNALNYETIKTKQNHGYNIISCIPSYL